jgi:uncharacterized membrane protein YphA (DoxX/SURF4 family)
MKKTNILYWTFTALFAAFMLMSGIQNLMVTPEWVTIMNNLGYPSYLLPFMGVAKCLGVLALVVPGYPRIKEWAYAGFFFDLVGATYSVVVKEGPQLPHTFMLVLLVVMGLSYFYHHKRQRQLQEQPLPHGSAIAA